MRYRYVALVLVVLVALLVAPAAAAVGVIILDERIDESLDTSGSYDVTGTNDFTDQVRNYRTIMVRDVCQISDVYYIVISKPGACSLPEGESAGSYSIGGRSDVCQYRVVNNFDDQGRIKSHRLSIFPGNWSVDGLQGSQHITFDQVLWSEHHSCSGRITDSDLWIMDGSDSYPKSPLSYHIAYATRITWANHIKITESVATGDYFAEITRHLDDRIYPSTLNVYDADGDLTYTQNGASDISKIILTRSDSHMISIVSAAAAYNRTISSDPPQNAHISLSLTDRSVVGDTLTATLTADADAPRYSEISYAIRDPDGSTEYRHYSKTADWTGWQRYNKTSKLQDPCTEADAHSITVVPTGAGTWTVSAIIRDREPPSTGAALAEVQAVCEVARPAGSVDVEISIMDGARSSPSYLSGVGLTVKDLTAGGTVLYDSSETYLIGDESGTCNGLATVSVPKGDEIEITAERSGYVSQTWREFVRPTALPLNVMPLRMTLMPAATPAPDEIYVSFSVTTPNGYVIEGATVSASGHVGQTNNLGVCRLRLPANTTVKYTATCSPRYSDASGLILTGAVNTQATIYLYPAVTHVPTPAPGEPGAEATQDYRTADEKAESAMNILFDNVETFAGLAVLVLLVNMMFWIMPGGKR